MNHYFALSTEERITLSQDELEKSIKLEAIDRGIKTPITLSEALRAVEYRGYVIPQDAVRLFEVVAPQRYGSNKGTGLCYLDRDSAVAALSGAVFIEDTGYGSSATRRITSGDFAIQESLVGFGNGSQKAVTLESFEQDNTDFEKVRDECLEDYSIRRQAAYNLRVDLEKRAEYLKLAGNDEVIARAFWAKTERREWPEGGAK